MNTEIEKVQTALAAFDQTEAGLQSYRDTYASVVYPVTTPVGMKEAIAARRAIREPRVATEKVRTEAKAPLLALGRQLDAKAAYIKTELLKLEDPIDQQIKAEEARKEKEIHDENMRQTGIKERINDLGLLVPKMAGKSTADLAQQIADLEAHDLTEWAAEFIVDAERAREQTVQALQRLHAGALAQEQAAAAEAAKVAAERAELDRLRKEAAERQAADEARNAAERAQREADAAVHAREEQAWLDRIAAEERAARQAIEQAEAESRARIAEQERAARERQQALEREEAAIRAKQVELADAEGMCRLFVQRYSKLSQFGPMVTWINKYFDKQKAAA